MKNISIIVPMYNEEERIQFFLPQLLSFSKKTFKDYEIILVNDGSKDNTLGVTKRLTKDDKSCRIISYKKNKGKGAAVRLAILAARKDKVLFIDADGSIMPKEIPKMLAKLDKYDVVVGDRMSKNSLVIADGYRKLVGSFFNTIVALLFGTKLKDNLCGFKGFKRKTGIILFKNMISKRWAFDVEIFYRIRKEGFSLYYLPINWEHKDNSKINSLFGPAKIFLELLGLRIKLFLKFKKESKN
jgi:glycosyltransferase involved in cell wall biosynthesis